MGRVFIRIFIILIVPGIVGAITFFGMRHYFFEPANPQSTEVILFEVPPDMSFRALCKGLESKGLIRHWRVLDFLSRFKGRDTQIKAGEYELKASMTPKEILTKLISGDVFKRVVTIKEGAMLTEIGPILEQAGVMQESQFFEAVRDKALLTKAGIQADSFEGYLFPETYYFSRTDGTERVLWTMIQEGEKRWTPELRKALDESGFTRHEALTLASIIEKEAANQAEQPVVSSVFHNRLDNAMKLQADPTVTYGRLDYNGSITQDMLDDPQPYNTYVHFGLPPGPICNPGESAIRATLFPKTTTYLFFVSDGKGGHVFSSTLREHNEAVAKFRVMEKDAAKELEALGVPIENIPSLGGEEMPPADITP